MSPWMRTKQAAENDNLIFTGGDFLEAVNFIPSLGITDVQNPRPPGQLCQVTHCTFSHCDLVIWHCHPFYFLGWWVPCYTIGNILLMLSDQFIEHVLCEGPQNELQHLNLLALPLLVILPDVFPMANFVGPVRLDS